MTDKKFSQNDGSPNDFPSKASAKRKDVLLSIAKVISLAMEKEEVTQEDIENAQIILTLKDEYKDRNKEEARRLIARFLSQLDRSDKILPIHLELADIFMAEITYISPGLKFTDEVDKKTFEIETDELQSNIRVSEQITTFKVNDPFEGKNINQEYYLKTCLGKGGAGRVYLAKLMKEKQFGSINDEVVVKIYHPEILGIPNQEDRIRNEGFLISSRESVKLCSNISKVFELQLVDGDPYLILEYVEGQNLLEQINQRNNTNKKFLEFHIIDIALSIFKALEVLHKEGLIHRDIKPENIIIPTDEDRGAVLLDFGIVKDLSKETITYADQFLGSWHYAPPEMFSNRKPTEKTDLYLLGATLYHVITLRKPFEGISKPLIVNQPELCLSTEECSNDMLRDLINRLLKHDPDLRPGLSEVKELLTEIRNEVYN